jgi:RNA polymerase sigma-70 factor (ECF subfamily)
MAKLVQVEQLEAHRVALTGHCYRMLGSPFDADDAVQETMLRAWRSVETFDGRSSLRTWLFRIATNVCLDALAARTRRVRPFDDAPVGRVGDTLHTRPSSHWLLPVPDARVLPDDTDPHERLRLRESIRLAFVAALQTLPAKQRACLLLCEVLGWPVAEVAEHLELSTAAVNSALQRARATLATCIPEPQAAHLSTAQAALVERYCAAFERYDVRALASLMREDAKLCMPPYSLWLQGTHEIQKWMSGPGAPCRGSRLLRTEANGLPAFAQFRPAAEGGHKAWSLIVLELSADAITSVTSFLDVENCSRSSACRCHCTPVRRFSALHMPCR